MLDIQKEIWKDIEGFEGLYQVSNLGRVKSLSRVIPFMDRQRVIKDRILKQNKIGTITKYYSVSFPNENKQARKYLVHKLVVEAFICIVDEGLVINHKDGNSLNNNLDNLEITTQQKNVQEERLRSKRTWKRCTYRLINVNTNEEIDFDSSVTLAKHLNISSASVRSYANEIWLGLFDDTYKIIKIQK